MSSQGRNRTWREDMMENLKKECEIPDTWHVGPVRNQDRTITDKCCCLIFIAFMLFLIGSAIWVGFIANTKNLNKIYDSEGNVCGQGNAAAYPYLYFQTFSKPFKTVCVKSCPKFDYNAIKYNVAWGQAGAAPYPGPLDYPQFSK